MQAHDPYIFTTLHSELRTAARYLHAPSERFDLVFVTGDISTNAGSEERFHFAMKYLTDVVQVSDTFSAGLKIPSSNLFCVPGNHDKLGEDTRPSRYSKFFGRLPDSLPYTKTVEIESSKQKFYIYGIDSNLYEEGNIAIGKITPETFGWLSEQLSKLASESEIDNGNDQNRALAIRVLLLHHHPADLNPLRRHTFRNFISSLFAERFTRLEEGDRLLSLCKGRIDLICHGHEHFPVVFPEHTSHCLIVSGGTTSQFYRKEKVSRNSFHALAFYGRLVKGVQFDWTGARFTPAVRWSCNLDDVVSSFKEEPEISHISLPLR